MLKKIPFIRTGKFTDKNGTDVEIRDETLDKIIKATKAFAYQNNEIPLVIGHPKEDSPAWGWVNNNSIEKSENILNALADDKSYSNEFKEWLDKKLYKTVSVALRPDWSIKHIGFLGAMPPAITGLPAVELHEEPGEMNLEFSSSEFRWVFKSIGSVLRNIKNYFIEKEGTEKADEMLPEYALNELNDPPEPAKENNFFTEPNKEETQTIMNGNDKKEENKEFTEKLAAKDIELQDARAETEKIKREAKRKEYVAFCESPEVANKIVPAQKQSFIELMELVDKTQELEFTEGAEVKKLKPLEFIEGLIKQLPDVVDLTRNFANNHNGKGPEDETSPKEIANEAREFMESQGKLGITISHSEAVKTVMNKKNKKGA